MASFTQIQKPNKKRQRSPVESSENPKRHCPPTILTSQEDQIMTDLANNVQKLDLFDDYTIDELIDLYPLWMSTLTVDVDNLLYKD